MNLHYSNDGLDHINIYSKGRTELGRFLSNFTYCELILEEGTFCSVEGYWYYLSSKDEKLKKLYGWQAKNYGREIGAKDWLNDEEFKQKICQAISYKIENTNDFLKKNFALSTLPFTHYYSYGGKTVKVEQGQWIIDFIEQKRKEMKKLYV